MSQNNEKNQVRSAALAILVATTMLMMMMGGFTYTGKAATKEIGGDLVAGIYEAPETTNPLEATEDALVMWLMYDSLAVYKPTEGILPWLADSWEVMPDNITVNVTLKSGVTFTDGTPLTSADVVYTYEQYMAGTGVYHGYVSSIDSVTAVDDLTVQFVLSSRNSDFFTKALLVPVIKINSADSPVGTGPFMGYEEGTMTGTDMNVTLNDPNDPAGRQGGTDVEFQLSHKNVVSVTIHVFAPIMVNGTFQGTNWSDETVLNETDYKLDGPNGTLTINSMSEFDYVTVDFTFTASTVTLYVNPDYFMGRPYLDSITLVISESDAAMVDDLNNGRIDVILENIDPYYKSVIQEANVVKPVTTKTVELIFNCGSVPLNNSEFRKAISYAIDKDFFVSKTLQNSGIKGDSIVPRDNIFWYNSTLTPRPYDESLASSTLTQAGFVDVDGDGFIDLPDGSSFSLTLMSVGITEVNYLAAEAQTLEGVFQRIGINTTWVQDIAENISSNMYAGNFDMIVTEFEYPLDPGYLNDFVTGDPNNFMQYSNPDFDEVMGNASVAMSVEEKQKYIKEAQGILYDDTAVVVLAYLTGLQYYNGEKYEGFQSMINGITNKFTFLEAYHVVIGNLAISLVPSASGVEAGNTVSITITVSNEEGLVEGAKVYVSASAGNLSETELVTNGDGEATIDLIAPSVEAITDITITATAYKPGFVHAEGSLSITVHPPAKPLLMVNIDVQGGSVEVGSGNSTAIPVTVRADNEAVEGATVEVILEPSITGAEIELSSETTDANGEITITFTAPSTSVDISYTLTVVAHKEGYQDSDPYSTSATITVVVNGGEAPEPPTERVDKVPGFEAIGFIAALGLAGMVYARRKRK